MAIIIHILTQFDDKGIKSAVREFERAKGSLDKFGAVGKIFTEVGQSLTKNLTVPLLGVAGALGVMVKGAIDAEKSQLRLRQILTTTGKATESQIDSLLKQASALEKIGVVSKENIVTTQAQLSTFDLQGNTIAKLTPAILDYVTAEKGAAASADDFKSMTNGLAQALNGNFASLTRVGFVLDEDTKKKIANGTESERAAALVEVLNSTYKGFNEELAKTPEGQMLKLKQEFGDLANEVGSALLPIVMQLINFIRTNVIPQIQKWVDWFKQLNPETLKLILGIGAAVAALGPMLIVLGQVIIATKQFIGVVRLLTLALIQNPIGAVVALLALLVIGLVHAWKTSDTFRQGVAKLGNMFIWFAETVINGVIAYLNMWIKSINTVLKGLQKLGINVELIGEISDVAFTRLKFASVEAGNSVGALAAQTDTLGNDVSKVTVPAITNLNNGLEKTTENANKVKDAAKKVAQTVVDNLEKALRKAESALEDVKNKFDNFKNAIVSTITGILDFGKAAETGDFLKGLTNQAVQATAFADKVKKLVVMGLNESAIRQVLNAGFEAGSKIADEIIAGGQTVIDQVNNLVASVESVAEEVGISSAEAFYQAGITQGEAIVAGIRAALERARAELAQIVEDLSGASVSGGGGAGGGATTTTAGAPAKKPKPKPKPAPAKKPSTQLQNKLKQMTNNIRFAKGGIVLGPTNAIIGEAGPEAVIPLSGANSAGMGNVYNITVNAGIGTSGAQVGRDIVEAIKKYERTSGQVFARA